MNRRPAVNATHQDLCQRLASLASPTTVAIRALRREFSRRLAKAPPEVLVAFANQLLEQPGLNHGFVAYELIYHHRAALRSLGAAELEHFGQGMDSWGAVDCFSCYIAGPVWRERQVSDSVIQGWARSQDRWWRRAALVSTVPLNSKARGGQGDTVRTLRICRMLIADRDDMVVKALSWALRELAKRDAGAVSQFLEENRPRLAARVLREVTSKLATGLKNPRRQ